MGEGVETYVARQRSNAKDKIELSDGLLVDHGIGTADILFVEGKESWAMQNRKQWSPFLEKDVDHLVRDQTRWCLERDDAPWSA